MSGHIFFNDRWKGFDDGIYAGARMLEIIASQMTKIYLVSYRIWSLHLKSM